jgi:hypothetical protein
MCCYAAHAVSVGECVCIAAASPHGLPLFAETDADEHTTPKQAVYKSVYKSVSPARARSLSVLSLSLSLSRSLARSLSLSLSLARSRALSLATTQDREDWSKWFGFRP